MSTKVAAAFAFTTFVVTLPIAENDFIPTADDTTSGANVPKFLARNFTALAATGSVVFASLPLTFTISCIGLTTPAASSLIPAISSAVSLNISPASATTAFSPPDWNAFDRRLISSVPASTAFLSGVCIFS